MTEDDLNWVPLDMIPDKSPCCDAPALAGFSTVETRYIDGYCSKCSSRFIRWDSEKNLYQLCSKPVKHVRVGRSMYEAVN